MMEATSKTGYGHVDERCREKRSRKGSDRLNPTSMSSPHPRKAAPIGIAAGAEDAKYHVKYKELKRKVKDIEAVSSILAI